MRKLFLLLVLLVSLVTYAQRDVTKFLGIPVDGSKMEMIQKLKDKGFIYDKAKDVLTGEFNDQDVIISVVTKNNKVSRIAVIDKNSTNEAGIKIRFNNLCGQFERNGKYFFFSDQRIPDSDDISFEMSVRSKRYEAIFYKKQETYDKDYIKSELNKRLLGKYSDEELANPITETAKEEIENATKEIALDLISKCPVWFMIDEKYGDYKILLYYDNEYNKSDGADL